MSHADGKKGYKQQIKVTKKVILALECNQNLTLSDTYDYKFILFLIVFNTIPSCLEFIFESLSCQVVERVGLVSLWIIHITDYVLMVNWKLLNYFLWCNESLNYACCDGNPWTLLGKNNFGMHQKGWKESIW